MSKDAAQEQPQTEVWYTYRIFTNVEGFEADGPRLLKPFSDPSEFEDTFDLIWPIANEAKWKMRVWIALHADEIGGLPNDDVRDEFEDADYDTGPDWWRGLSEPASQYIEDVMKTLTLVRITLEPIPVG